jgi:hypothetical protein
MLSMERAKNICDVSPTIRQRVALELKASFPFPVTVGQEIFLRAFYYARFGPPPRPLADLYPPNWLVTLSPDNGRLVALEEKPPQFYGIDGAHDKPFAQHAYTYDWTPEELERNKKLFFDIYDRLFRDWRRNPLSANADPEEKRIFRRLFNELSPSPLLKSYLAVGRDFFTWVGF